MSMGSHGGIVLTEEKPEPREKPVPVSFCPPQIQHGLTAVV
jgi:hypothetical protein